MDLNTYDQMPLSKAVVKDALDWIRPNDEVDVHCGGVGVLRGVRQRLRHDVVRRDLDRRREARLRADVDGDRDR